jgi:hypothetical protein
MGVQLAKSYLDDDYSKAMLGFQGAAQERDTAYQMKVWDIQDRQRALGHRQTLSGFKFQEQGMQLQQQGLDMNNKFFWQNTGLQQQQTTMQRGFQRQDWAIDDSTRAMQWGWKTEDFQEEKRFMTGRQRRLAERGMERDTTMHGVTEDKVTRDKARQEELWKLEDTRFDLQLSQHTEQMAQSQAQLDLQRKQFEENKKFYFEGRKLEEEMIKLQREHWLASNKAAKEQLALTVQHQKDVQALKEYTDRATVATELFNGEMNTLVEDSLARFQQWIIDTVAIVDNINSLGTTGSGSPVNMESSYANQYGNNWSSLNNNPIVTNYPAIIPVASPAPGHPDHPNPNAGYADGGPAVTHSMTNIVKVGEEGWEFLMGGKAIPHDESVQMERQGVRAGSSLPSLSSGSLEGIAPRTIPGSSSGNSAPTQKGNTTIIVHVGNQELKRFVVDALGDEF